MPKSANTKNTKKTKNLADLPKSVAILYKSKYGATKKYAKWLKQAIENMGNIKNTQDSAKNEGAKNESIKKESAKKQTIQNHINHTKHSPIYCINCDIYDVEDTSAPILNQYDIIIFAGALYGGELSIVKSIKDFLACQKNATNNTNTANIQNATKIQNITNNPKSTNPAQNPQNKSTQNPKICPNLAQIYCLIIGLSSPKNALSYQKALDKNLSKEEQRGIRFYFLQGGIDFGRLDSGDRARMEAYRAMLRAKEDKSPEQEALLAHQRLDFARKDLLEPVVDEIIRAR